MKTFVLGDIHGACKALQQCLERSSFDLSSDHLIFLGDVADRGPETADCVDLLLSIKHLTAVIGNHDEWTRDWLTGDLEDPGHWFTNGGKSTYESYTGKPDFESVKQRHLESYYSKMLTYFKDDQNRVFVHAGFDWRYPIEQTTPIENCWWDRSLFNKIAQEFPVENKYPEENPYHEIYIGHSPTHRLEPQHDGSLPVKIGNVWCMDQGAGWGKRLSMMNIDTKDVYQSDEVDKLYDHGTTV